MSKTCKEAGCYHPVFSRSLCHGHWKYAYGKPLPRPIKKVRQVSERRKIANKQYSAVRSLWLPGHKICEAQLPGCTDKATEVHHMKGREGELLLITTYWLAVCSSCHRWITDNSRDAIELGLSLRRHEGCG